MAPLRFLVRDLARSVRVDPPPGAMVCDLDRSVVERGEPIPSRPADVCGPARKARRLKLGRLRYPEVEDRLCARPKPVREVRQELWRPRPSGDHNNASDEIEAVDGS